MNLNPDKVPSTIAEAIDELYNGLSEEDRKQIMILGDNDVHFTLGSHIRNNWSLWETSTPLVQDFISRFRLFGHGDDVSSIILCGVFARVKGFNEENEIFKRLREIRLHWREYGMNSETGKPL